MSTYKSKSVLKTVIIVALGVLVLVGAIFGIVKLVEFANKETKTVSPSYVLGSLNEEGKYVASKDTLYTKNMFECVGLQTELDFDATVKYQIFFYNGNKDFITHTTWLADTYDTVPSFAKYARIVIKPVDDDNISTFEKIKYQNQVTLTVLKDQSVKDVDSFKVDSDRTGKTISLDATTFTLTGSGSDYSFSKDINCLNAAEVEVGFKGANGNVVLWFIDSTTGVVVNYEFDVATLKAKSDGLYHTSVKVPEGAYKAVLQVYTDDIGTNNNVVYVR